MQFLKSSVAFLHSRFLTVYPLVSLGRGEGGGTGRHSANRKLTVQIQNNVCFAKFENTASPAVLHLQQMSNPSLGVTAAPLPRRGCWLQWKPESTVRRGKIIQAKKKKKKFQSKYQFSSHIHPFKKKKNPPCYPLLSPSHAKRNSHILTLSIHLYTIIYLHSYLKYFFYKCVYKLKIISLCLVTKWHLQGRGCVGLRFVIALQEPTKRQHQTLSK